METRPTIVLLLSRPDNDRVIDVTAFRAFERAGWDVRAGGYDRFFSAVSEHNVQPLLNEAGVQAGDRVLDAGCGPGNLAAGAASRGAAVLGIDLSETMVGLAQRRHPELEFRQADAEHLPFSDATFDAVVANLLIPHLPNPEAGMAEFVRVLKPSGRLAVSMWDTPSRSRLIGIMWEAIAEVGAPPPTGLPPGPPALRFADEKELAGLLLSSDLENVNIRQIEFMLDLSDAAHIWKGWIEGSVRTASAVLDQPPEIQGQIRAAFERRASVYANEEGVRIPVSFLIASGRRR